MDKKIILVLASLFVSSVYADIPYCPGTKVEGGKHRALQYVVKTFAAKNHCAIDSTCLLNFNKIKYAIAWSQDCMESASQGNDPKGSTFICNKGRCFPYGFSYPKARY